MWLVEAWWDQPTLAHSLAIGAVAALLILVRHTNAIFVLLLPLYGIVGWRDVQARAPELRDRWRLLALAAAAGVVVLAPQLALYKWITGQWLVNPYVTHGVDSRLDRRTWRRCCSAPRRGFSSGRRFCC